MDYKDKIIKLIEDEKENSIIDFKKEYYKDNYDLVKDVAAFANTTTDTEKFIVFGVTDSHEMLGISSSELVDVSTVNDLVNQYIEPFIDIEIGSFEYKNISIGYLAILPTNNKPYLIKKQFGLGKSTVQEGTIFIRKGASNFRANRSDIDLMYKNKIQREVKLYRNLLRVCDIQNSKSKEILTYGRVELELKNDSDMPWLIRWGYIKITNCNAEIERPIYTLEGLRLDDHPYSVKPKNHEKVTFPFEFMSSDCIYLKVDDEGNMLYETNASVILYDTDDNEYKSDKIQILLTVRGNALHKIKRLYTEFRKKLIYNEKYLLKLIETCNNSELENELKKGYYHFELLQPHYVLGNSIFPEYNVTYQMISSAINNQNVFAIDLLLNRGVPNDFIDFCKCYNK